MTSEGLGEMFEGDSADTCAGKFPFTSMGADWRISHAQTRERGPHRRERKFLYLQDGKLAWLFHPNILWAYVQLIARKRKQTSGNLFYICNFFMWHICLFYTIFTKYMFSEMNPDRYFRFRALEFSTARIKYPDIWHLRNCKSFLSVGYDI